MKKAKNFWKYFTITILLLLGLCCAGILYMFFVGAPLFNFKYVSYNKSYYSSEYSVENNSINTVKLINGRFEVKVLDSSTNNISMKVHNGVFGFTTKQSANFDFSENLDKENGVLTFTITEPHGFAATGRSSIELYLPETGGLDLILSNTGAKTSFNSKVEINNLSYTTRSGDFEFNQGKISGQMNLSLGRASFKIADAVETNTNEVNLKMTSGSFNCPNKEFDVINLISSTSGVLRAGKCNEINGENENAGGSITIDMVGNANLVAGDTNVRISTLTSGIIEIGKTGRININKTLGRVNLHAKAGNIWVGEANYELTCTSSSGNISIDKSYKVVNAETTSGDISINFDFEGNTNSVGDDKSYATKNSYSEDKDNRRVIVKTASGTINCYGVENIDATITGAGAANIYLENVLGDNIIKSEKNGSVYVQVKEFTRDIMPDGWAHFVLDTQSSGYVRVNFTQMDETYGKTNSELHETINPYLNKEQENGLKIEMGGGSLTVLDSKTATIR